MRHNGILGKQHGKLVTPFRLLIFKEFFIPGEILEHYLSVLRFRDIAMRTVSETQSRFFRFPENHWVRIVHGLCFSPDNVFQLGVYNKD